jgi:hypothetical protein
VLVLVSVRQHLPLNTSPESIFLGCIFFQFFFADSAFSLQAEQNELSFAYLPR